MKIEELDEDGRCVELPARKRKLVVTDTKRALVGAGARILFYPTLLYNVFRNKIQAEFRWWDEIDQFILLGAVPFPKDVPRLKQLGVGGVITLNEAYETLVPTSAYLSHGIDHLVIPTRDYLFAPSFEDITKAVDFIHKKASRRTTTYVHCKAGRGRSTTIVLCYLVEHKRMTPRAALDYVRSIRPRVLLAPSQWKAVQEYNKLQSVILKPAALTLGPCSNPESGAEGSVTSSPSLLYGDVVMITNADLEGYRSGDEENERNELVLGSRVVARLSCLFTSLSTTDRCTTIGQRLTQTQAC